MFLPFGRKKPVSAPPGTPRALLVGFFNTVGDMDALRVVQKWLAEEGLPHDVAPYSRHVGRQIDGAEDLLRVDAGQYTHIIVVCGPCWPALLEKHQINQKRFGHCKWIGVNLTMIEPVSDWNPFDILYERDSDRMVRPDISFAETRPPAVLVGRCVIAGQREYGARQQHDQALRSFDAAIARHGFTAIDVDTKWPRARNQTGLSSPQDVIAVLGHCDLVFTNRLHGMVFSLKAGTPVVAIDGISGGDKVAAQARILDWPRCATVEQATPEWIDAAIAWCLTDAARLHADRCAESAREAVADLGAEFGRTLA